MAGRVAAAALPRGVSRKLQGFAVDLELREVRQVLAKTEKRLAKAESFAEAAHSLWGDRSK
jgi:hypothetical protein